MYPELRRVEGGGVLVHDEQNGDVLPCLSLVFLVLGARTRRRVYPLTALRGGEVEQTHSIRSIWSTIRTFAAIVYVSVRKDIKKTKFVTHPTPVTTVMTAVVATKGAFLLPLLEETRRVT